MALMVCNRPSSPSIVFMVGLTIFSVLGLCGLWSYFLDSPALPMLSPVIPEYQVLDWTTVEPTVVYVPIPTPRPKIIRVKPKPKPLQILPIMPIIRGDKDMEIKGLAERFKAAKARIAEARDATGKFDETVGAFVVSLNDVTTQIDAMHSDLKFEAETIGNGGPGNEAQQTASGTVGAVGSKPSEVAHMPSTKVT